MNIYPLINPIQFVISNGIVKVWSILKIIVIHLLTNFKSLGILTLAGICYAYTMYNTIDSTMKIYETLLTVKKKVSTISSFLQCSHRLLTSIHTSFYSPTLQRSFDILEEFILYQDTIEASLLNPSGYEGHGKILKLFHFLLYDERAKKALVTIIQHIGYIDHLYSMKVLLSTQSYTIPTYIISSSPKIEIDNMWHPNISKNIPNDIKTTNNMIITGPNMGGKSTFIKNILLNVLLSQTIGISNSTLCSFTPFELIHTHINIPDLTGTESLFEAEVNRIFHYVYDSVRLHNGVFGLGVFDEILSSTNVVDGISVGMAMCEKFANMTNNLSIVTTHFDELTKNKSFDNYRVCITRQPSGEIFFPYKIEPGVAKDKIAIELLRKKGFEHTIIDRALELKTTLYNN